MAGKLRVSGGYLVRRQFRTPPLADAGLVRPATDRVRQAIFSSIVAHLSGAKVLDLFGGSGAYSFEAISRGAAHATIIEKNRDTAKCIEENIRSLELQPKCALVVADALHFVQKTAEPYDLIFVDPPYTLELGREFFLSLFHFAHAETLVVYRCFKKLETDFGDAFEVTRDRAYGNTRVFFLRRLPKNSVRGKDD